MSDYKGVAFSFSSKRRTERLKWLRRLIFFSGLAAMLFLIVFYWQRHLLHSHMQALLTENITPQNFRQKLSGIWFFPDACREGNALSFCFDDVRRGRENLAAISSRSTFFDTEPILNHLLERPSPLPFMAYARFLDQQRQLGLYFRLLLSLSSYQAVDDQTLVAGLETVSVQSGATQLKERITQINRQMRADRVVVIRDRDNVPLATWSVKKQHLDMAVPGFDPSVLSATFAEGFHQQRLTLNLALQEHAHQLFSTYHGSLILLDILDGGILAAYSKPFPGEKGGNTSFSQSYEPGSIIKLLTLFTYLQQSGPSIFPFNCQGNMVLDGRLFYDWMTHGKLSSPQEAMAVSCNMVFARLGLNLGAFAVKKGLTAFLFDRHDPLLSDGPFTFTMGSSFNPADNHGLANLAIGLKEVQITTLHAALLAGLIADNGILPSPHLLASGSTLLGLISSPQTRPVLEVFPRSIHYLTLQQSMALAVDHPQGTARRAQNDRLSCAVKTGTAGESSRGLDAIIIAYFPRQAPRYALAFRLERAGKAEYQGAQFLNRYLSTFPLKKPSSF